MGHLGRCIAIGTVGQVDCKWDTWADVLRLGQLGRWNASNVVSHILCY